MAQSLRIVVSARDVVGTGGGTVAIETARCFAQRGHQVALVVDTELAMQIEAVSVRQTVFGSWLKNWQPQGRVGMVVRHFLQIFIFSFLGRALVGSFEEKKFVSIDHNIEAFGGDIIVLHNVFIAQYKADRRHWARKSFQFFNPVFCFRLLREQISFRSKWVKAVIAVSEQTLADALPYLSENTLKCVIHNGINLTRFHSLGAPARAAHRQSLGATDRFVMLFVGHEFERKRLDLVLQAVAQLPVEVCLWVIGGRGSSTDTYVQMAQKLGVSDRVRFWGTVVDTESYFQAADVFVLPSDYETWGLVVMEAMACGTPVLMTPVGCAPHVVINGETGYVLDYTAASIAEKVGCMMADPAMVCRMRSAARAVAEKYGWDKVASKYLDVIAAVRERIYGT